MRKKNLLKLVFAILLAYVMIYVGTKQICEAERLPYWKLDDYITTEVIRTDGTKEQYDSNKFKVINRGDKLTATLRLPKELQIPNAGVSFHVSNMTVEVYWRGECLYSYGKEQYENGRMIGSLYPKFIVPEEAWGEDIIIQGIGAEREACATISLGYLMHAKDAAKYPMVGREVNFMLYISITLFSCMMGLYFILNGKYDRFGRQGIYLSLFCIAMSIWVITYSGTHVLISDRIELYANLEYVGLYCMPWLFSLYLLEQERGEKHEGFLRFQSWFFGILFCTILVLTYGLGWITLPQILKYFHMIMIGGCVSIIRICLTTRKTGKREKTVLGIGYIACVLLFLLDMLTYNLNKFTSFSSSNSRYAYSQVAVVIFVLTMVVSYELSLVEFTLSQKEKKRLEQLAYRDRMTNLINRAGCFEKMRELDAKEKYEYEVIYFDVNSLKQANDVFGHEKGDELLLTVSTLIQECFGNSAFCGRLGGDEFIVIAEGRTCNYLHRLIEEFEARLRDINEKCMYPFKVSVSFGIERHGKKDTRDAEVVIRAADSKMYVKKKMAKR